MQAYVDALKEQNRLLAEQNRLLRQAPTVEIGSKNSEERDGLMTERDLQLILMSDDVLAAIDRWNKSCTERAKRKRGK